MAGPRRARASEGSQAKSVWNNCPGGAWPWLYGSPLWRGRESLAHTQLYLSPRHILSQDLLRVGLEPHLLSLVSSFSAHLHPADSRTALLSLPLRFLPRHTFVWNVPEQPPLPGSLNGLIRGRLGFLLLVSPKMPSLGFPGNCNYPLLHTLALDAVTHHPRWSCPVLAPHLWRPHLVPECLT